MEILTSLFISFFSPPVLKVPSCRRLCLLSSLSHEESCFLLLSCNSGLSWPLSRTSGRKPCLAAQLPLADPTLCKGMGCKHQQSFTWPGLPANIPETLSDLAVGEPRYPRLASAQADEHLWLRTMSKSGHSAEFWVTVPGSGYASHQFSLCGKG